MTLKKLSNAHGKGVRWSFFIRR